MLRLASTVLVRFAMPASSNVTLSAVDVGPAAGSPTQFRPLLTLVLVAASEPSQTKLPARAARGPTSNEAVPAATAAAIIQAVLRFVPTALSPVPPRGTLWDSSTTPT